MPPKLLESQLQTLEPLDPSVEPGAVVSVELPLGTRLAFPLNSDQYPHNLYSRHNFPLFSCDIPPSC
jgi:hypothetical protein